MNKKEKTDTNRNAIVMGATSGIGMEVALLLAKKGWHVGIAGRRTERLSDVMQRNTNIIAKRTIDVNSEYATTTLYDMIREMGGLDLYVHSSGIGWHNYDLDQEKELMTANTNILGFTRMVSTVFNYMAERGTGGHITCVTSIAGTKGLGAAPSYSATKRYQAHYLECLAQLSNLRNLHITITDIRPGFVDTALIEGSKYPLKLPVAAVAKDIVKAIDRKASVRIIDWRYKLLVCIWKLIPRWMWVRMNIK